MTATQSAEGPAPSRLIAAEIRAEVARQGSSTRKLALRMGVTQAWLQRRIGYTGDLPVTPELVVEIAKALGVSPERLLVGWLPRLDSNQQPSGSRKAQVRAQVIDLAARRERKSKTPTGADR